MAAMMVVFWGLVILGVVWVIRSLGPGHQHQRPTSALDLLDQRLASGEITPKGYRERRDLLTRGSEALIAAFHRGRVLVLCRQGDRLAFGLSAA